MDARDEEEAYISLTTTELIALNHSTEEYVTVAIKELIGVTRDQI